MTALVQTPSSNVTTGYNGSKVKIEFSMAYIEEKPINFKENAVSKTEKAYVLRFADKTTKDLPTIIEAGRLVSIKYTNGVCTCVILHPKLQLISDINKFVFINESNAFLLSAGGVRCSEDQYRKLSAKVQKY